ncbi:MAG: hypothetical protein K2N34_12795, partial [Lachnospiraceae bacterium]|nr:hypothetical protein [Lachnospiraceae bacterium]
MANFKKVLSLLMAIILIAALMPAASFAAIAAKNLGLSYVYSNELAGFAEGMVTINTDETDSGNYYLYWADDVRALNGYYEISKVNVKDGEGKFEFLANIAIPTDATKLIAIKSDEEPEDKTVENADMVYEIPKNKQNPYKSSDKTLSFEALSDTQLDLQSSVFYTYSIEHFAAALENAQAREVDFVTTSGDCINNYQNGTSKEWQAFQKVIASSSYTNPIYEANGNHSMKSDIGYGIPAFETATGLNADNSELGDTPYYEITAKNGDHFLFVALETESDVAGYDQFSEKQMDWLESKLKEYYGDDQHIFIFEHAFFHGWGPGDDKVEHYYSGGLRTTSDFPGNARFRELMDTYTEVFLYTGHSHLDFEYNWNYDNEGGKTANLFHIPSTACTTHVTDGKLDYTMYEKSSQCYIVDVYDDMVISNGLNVVDNLIYPAYTYIVSTKDYTHQPVEKPDDGEEESTEESTKLVDVQIENATSYLYDDGAALFFYNNDSGNVFPVNSVTGIAQIPENATNLTLYRCKGSWNSGEENKSDSITSYWNKYGPAKREIGQTIFYVAGSSKFNWKNGDIRYPEQTTEEETTGGEITKEYTETKVYVAVPKDYAESGYSYKLNIKCLDGSYPQSPRELEDTQTTYKGMKVYAYTFSAKYTEVYDTLLIQRIQVQCYDGKTLVYQYAIEDKKYTISELDGKIFVADSDAPTGSKLSATESSFEVYKENAEEEKEYTETKVYVAVPKDYAESGYSYKLNIKCLDGSYPQSPRELEDTQTTYKGMKVYAYTFSAKYTEVYDTLLIQRIQVQCYDGKTLVYQYAIEDKEYTISELDGKIFVADSDAPTGSKLSAAESSFETYVEDIDEGDVVKIVVKDTTSSGWVYSSGAALYLYDADTGEHYDVSDEVASVPTSAVNIIVYRCDKTWGGGNKTDDVTTYWNKWDLAVREEGYDAINLTGDGASVWTKSSDFEIDTDAKYYLVGHFDGEDYEGRDYGFDENGEVEVQFYGDSYVYVISSSNTSYWTNGWLGENVDSATLYKASSLAKADKFFVPSGKIKFKLLVNNDGTLTISYECMPIELDKSELTLIEDETLLTQEADVSSLEKLINVTKDLLRADYRYSSYVDYAKLKKMYYT